MTIMSQLVEFEYVTIMEINKFAHVIVTISGIEIDVIVTEFIVYILWSFLLESVTIMQKI